MAGSRAASTRAIKDQLLTLLDQALAAGWSLRDACAVLELPERRAYRWLDRRMALAFLVLDPLTDARTSMRR